jgi:hypothetical protein
MFVCCSEKKLYIYKQLYFGRKHVHRKIFENNVLMYQRVKADIA